MHDVPLVVGVCVGGGGGSSRDSKTASVFSVYAVQLSIRKCLLMED